MKRVVEPEIMETKKQVVAYAKADFSDDDKLFVDVLTSLFKKTKEIKTVLDLGCGPAYVPIIIAKRNPKIKVVGVDGSKEMIAFGKRVVRGAELQNRIILLRGYIPGLNMSDHSYDAVISRYMLHHIHNPIDFWKEVKRLVKPDGVVLVMDLIRPKTLEVARKTVKTYAEGEDPILKRDFLKSLRASFIPGEVEKQLKKSGLKLSVKKIDERNMIIKGIIRG